jgi:hypothetical protein
MFHAHTTTQKKPNFSKPLGRANAFPRKRTEGLRKNKRKTKGWTPERRRAQAQRIRHLAIWKLSTGPKTDAGKARAKMNALKQDGRAAERRDLALWLRAQRYYVIAFKAFHELDRKQAKNRALRGSARIQKRRAETAFFLGEIGVNLLRSGIKFLEKNNG